MSAAEVEVLFEAPEPERRKAHRGTSNTNDRGSSEGRRRRRAWLLETYRANVDAALVVDPETGEISVYEWTDVVEGIFGDYAERRIACRCYRCGCLLVDETVTVDRIIPGCKGGTYKRNNIRPACGTCNSHTGQALSMARRSS